ncbi:MAG: RNA polymerase sigma factor RpoH [Moraxella sp.]|jgi:RNA polymerase sigma-32 factor|uniref:RNA polymerase sigma factor RpoH n=1 Tax=Faucicola osloensis TaxID=34062 RepID=A0A6P1KEU1_FAUOS|nr:RNA polymerase sigma factor RpoH [Moraxella osloensis]MBP6484797.1 RNA polymerase sigma factor RpoH [Moraxella sp.]MBP7234286.1 RNA polymerase sigma factor RpoH [Moraxella sp.]QHG09861.1 RNA polymerase sigma factor RpoH [Moraxella osloensis]
MATKTKTTTIKKTANAKKSTKLDDKLNGDPHAAFDDIDDDELDEFDEPDFDSLGDDDIDLAQLPDSYDDYDELVDEADDDYDDEFAEKPRKTVSRPRQKKAMTNALVPTMPTALSAPGVNLGAYINAVHQIPILTAEQEQELAHRYTDEGDVEAARLLVMSHLRFVIHIARSYSGYGLPQGDLIQEGNVGLMKAVKRFDPNKGVRLVSFAVHWIKAEIHEFVIRNWRIVKVATTKAHRKLFFNLRSLKKTNNQLTLEEAEAIAKDLNVTVKQVLEMESRLTSYDASFEAQSDDEDEGRYAPQYFLEDAADPADMVEDADWEENNNSALMEAMEDLDDRSRDIVQQRWLNEQKATLHELAAEYNISAERVRQIEKNAMDKIKEAMLANTHLQLD